jgi:hypothetical protein
MLRPRHNQSWPRKGMLQPRHNQFWPRKGMLRSEIIVFFFRVSFSGRERHLCYPSFRFC